jgi:hypothetical protein
MPWATLLRDKKLYIILVENPERKKLYYGSVRRRLEKM